MNNDTIARANAVNNLFYAGSKTEPYMAQVALTLVNGGATFVINSRDTIHERGYMVGGTGIESRVVNASAAPGYLATAFMQYQCRIGQNSAGSIYFGTWLDADGNIHLDASECIADLTDAINIAHERGELAIFCTITGRDIWVKDPYTGEYHPDVIPGGRRDQ